MKKLFICLFLLCALTSNAQVSLKGSVFLVPFIIGDYFITSATIGSEYKIKRLGIEYIFNKYSQEADRSFSYSMHQVSLKYYIINKADSFYTMYSTITQDSTAERIHTNRPVRIYISPFIHFKNIKAEEDDPYNPPEYNHQSANGTGYGILIGGTKDFTKHFGIEVGSYIYYLSVGKIYPVDVDKKHISSFLGNHYRLGLRIFLYFKLGKF